MKIIKDEIAVKEIDDNLFRITLKQPFYAANHLYLIRDDMPLLIDSGYIESIGVLSLSLKHLGLSLNKIDTVLYTHPHIDHITSGLLYHTYAKNIKRLGHYKMSEDIPNYLDFLKKYSAEETRLFKLTFADVETATKRSKQNERKWKRYFARFKNSVHKVGEANINLERHLKTDDVVETANCSLEIKETPGHCKWHITPIEHKKKWVFSGDLIIGNMTSIYDNLDGSLEDYHNSMNGLLKYNDYRFFPSHGDEIDNPEHKIKVITKSLSLLERGILRRVKEKRRGLLELMESAMGSKTSGGAYFILALAMIESILRKLLRENKIKSETFSSGYEEFFI